MEKEVRRWIFAHSRSVFTKQMSRARLRRFRETLKILDQREREIAHAHGWDRGRLRRNPHTGRLVVV